MNYNFEFKHFMKILAFNIAIFILLMIGSVMFEFLFLGWGASNNAPSFNADIALICQILIVGLMSFKKRQNRINTEMFLVFFIISITYLILKFVIDFF